MSASPGPTAPELRSRAVAALPWSAAHSFLSSVGSPLLTFVLSFWLTPHDLGLAGVASVLTTLSFALLGSALGQALVRLPDDEARLASGPLFWASLLGGLGLYGALWILAPALARLLDAPEVVWVLRVAGLRVPLALGAAVPFAIAQRELLFRRTAGPQLVAALVPLALAVPLATSGWGYRALVLGGLLGEILRAVGLALAVGFRPQPGLGWVTVRRHLSFGGWQLLQTLQGWALNMADNLIVGVALGVGALGHYSLGFNLATWGVGIWVEPATRVAYAAFSRLQADRVALKRAYLDGLGALCAVILPLGLGLSMLAEPLVRALFRPEWAPMSPVVAGLGLYAAAWNVLRLNAELLKAVGRPAVVVRLFGWLLLIALPAWMVVAPWGLGPFVWARALIVVPAALLYVAPVANELGVRIGELWRAVRGAVLACAALAASLLAVAALLPNASPLVALGTGFAAGSAAWGLALAGLDRPLLRRLLRLVDRRAAAA